MRTAPVFLYTSRCCLAQTKKDPCERTKEDRKENRFGQEGLGKWRCMGCKNKCAVTRRKNGTVAETTT